MNAYNEIKNISIFWSQVDYQYIKQTKMTLYQHNLAPLPDSVLYWFIKCTEVTVAGTQDKTTPKGHLTQ